MPGFVKVGTEAEAVGVAYEPTIDGCVDLDGAVRIFGINRAAADVEIERAAGEVGAINCQTCAAGIR